MINASQFPGTHASILNQPKRRKVQAGRAVEDAEEAPHSGATGKHMQRFFDALQDDDEHEQRHAFGKVVEAWRADNAAGGLAVYAHMPLPGIFARAIAQAVRDAPPAAGETITKGITANLEPGTRAAVLQQLRDAAGKNPSTATLPAWKPDQAAPHAGIGIEGGVNMHEKEYDASIGSLFKSLLKHEEVTVQDGDMSARSNRIAELKSLFEQARKGLSADAESAADVRRSVTLEYRPDRDLPELVKRRAETPLYRPDRGDPASWQNMPWNGERGSEEIRTLASEQGGWRWPWEAKPEPEVDPVVKRRNYETAQAAKELQYFSYDPADVANGVPGWSSPIVVFDNRFPPGFPKPLYDREWFRQNRRGFSGSLTRNQNSGDFAFLIRGVEVSDPDGRDQDLLSAALGQASVGQINEVGEDIYQQLKRRGVLRELARGRRLMLIGHSQGAPQAQLLGVYLIVRALQDGTLSEEQALRSIIVRGFGGTGAAGALRKLFGPDGRPLKIPPHVLEKIDAITYLLDADPARWGEEPYVGEPWLVDTPSEDKYKPDEAWARIARGHPRSAYRAADYSTARRDTKKRKGSFPDTRDRD